MSTARTRIDKRNENQKMKSGPREQEEGEEGKEISGDHDKKQPVLNQQRQDSNYRARGKVNGGHDKK